MSRLDYEAIGVALVWDPRFDTFTGRAIPFERDPAERAEARAEAVEGNRWAGWPTEAAEEALSAGKGAA